MEPKRIKTAMIGIGRWGKNVVRELADVSELVYFASQSDKNDAWAATALPGAKHVSVEEICADTSVGAVAIATPAKTHAGIIKQALEAGKHVLCEKPLTETSAEAYALAKLAKEKNLLLMTGYTFLYHPVYAEFKRFMKETKPIRVECVWKKHGTFTDVIENALLTHHLAIAYDLFGMPEEASVKKREAGETECDRIETNLWYNEREFASVIDRMSEEKVHTITATFDGGSTLVWDGSKLLRDGAVVFENSEMALTNEVHTFAAAVASGVASAVAPLTAGDFGAKVLEIQEMLR